MGILHKAGVTFSLKKRKLRSETVDYLGQVIRPRRLRLAKYANDAVKRVESHTRKR